MRTGRPTNDKKDSVIQLRVNSEQKKYISSKAKRMQITESEFVRGLIKSNMAKANS